MSARRCSTCAINWPINEYREPDQPVIDYKTCPACGAETDYFNNATPDDDAEEMATRAKTALFERYYNEIHLPYLEAEKAKEQEALAKHLDAEIDLDEVLGEGAS